MAKLHINIGDTANDRTGDPLRTAFEKVNANFDELYAAGNPIQYHLGDDLQFVDINPDTGIVVIQSGFDTGMPVYIKGANCADEGVGGNVIIEAGGAPLPNNGTTGNIELAAQQTTIESNNNMWSFRDDGVLELPVGGFIADSDGNNILDGLGGGNTGDLSFVDNELRNEGDASIKLATNASGGSRRVWTFYADGALELPTSNLGVGTIQSTNGIWLNHSGNMWKFDYANGLTLPAGGTINNQSGGAGTIYTFVNDGAATPGIAGDTVVYLPNNLNAQATQSGWIITFADATQKTVLVSDAGMPPHAAQRMLTFTGAVTKTGSEVWPLTVQSADYSAGGATRLEITPDGTTTWTFGADGSLTLPAGGVIKDSTGTNILDGLGGGSEAYFGTINRTDVVISKYLITSVDTGSNTFVVAGNAVSDTFAYQINIDTQTITYTLAKLQPATHLNGETTVYIDDIDDTVNPAWVGHYMRCVTRNLQPTNIGFDESFTLSENNVVGLKPLNTGNIGFVTDYIYDFNGITLENADLTHGATAAVIVPANGNSTNPIHLNNLYGPVRLSAGNNGTTKSWDFNSDGELVLPQSGPAALITSISGGSIQLQPKPGSIDGVTPNGGNLYLYAGDADTEHNAAGGSVYILATAKNGGGQDIIDGIVDITTAGGTWTFGTDGLLTFPGANGFRATFGSVEPVGDVLHSVNSLYLESEANVGLTSGADVADLESTYIEQETLFGDIRDQDEQSGSGGSRPRPWAGMPSYEAYDLIMAYNEGVGLPLPGNLAPAAYSAKIAYYIWQTARTNAGVQINVADKQWTFETDGNLTLPTGGEIKTAAGTGDVVVEANDGTARTWTFGGAGILSLPDFGATPGSGNGAVGDICRNGDTLYFKTGAGWAAIGMTLI